ncbi:MAG: hypothetical protein APZ16_05160 [Candidatus Hadarchaeum yellowstonense]|uniref:ATP-citrate synthase/succinyl-CoA ligase C-terminal domain-containing protein n=1 Tax=Hadarchaeum yellowstonense TaxID=1776334 RepID=A0A147JVX6_HADYE|nr:MAG: hypothetical protein APZ16_05160 [Candidatus Hadarchaeum yellowstonense]
MVEIAVISSSGVQAAGEAMEAIRSGKNVVFLGGGLSLTEEAALKSAASERGLLFLGPGCSTSILNGQGFGIWNKVRRGPIGIIGTFGSGIQQVACLVDGVGVSQALDVGCRDLSQSVNASGTLSALKFLAEDPATEVIAVLSREPVTSVRRLVLEAAAETGKPAVACFLGGRAGGGQSGVTVVSTLEEAAAEALALSGAGKPDELSPALPEKFRKIAAEEYGKFGYGQKFVRGLYSGGALCTETMVILRRYFDAIYSNVPLEPKLRLPDPHSSKGHACVDFGAEYLSGGKHPAVDLTPRCERLVKEAKDWETAVVLFDVLLGFGAHPNPAGELVPALREAKEIVEESGGYLSAVASVLGTGGDPQDLRRQVEQLERAGVLVMNSNARAAKVAALIATQGKIWKSLAR